MVFLSVFTDHKSWEAMGSHEIIFYHFPRVEGNKLAGNHQIWIELAGMWVSCMEISLQLTPCVPLPHCQGWDMEKADIEQKAQVGYKQLRIRILGLPVSVMILDPTT